MGSLVSSLASLDLGADHQREIWVWGADTIGGRKMVGRMPPVLQVS